MKQNNEILNLYMIFKFYFFIIIIDFNLITYKDLLNLMNCFNWVLFD